MTSGVSGAIGAGPERLGQSIRSILVHEFLMKTICLLLFFACWLATMTK
jgi:hypothetical protein